MSRDRSTGASMSDKTPADDGPVEISTTLVEIERREFVSPDLRGRAESERVLLDDSWELPFSVRRRFLTEITPDFGAMKAFGMWADREESDEELLNKLGAQWGARGESD